MEEQLLKEILGEVKGMKEEFQDLNNKVDGLDNRMENMESKVGNIETELKDFKDKSNYQFEQLKQIGVDNGDSLNDIEDEVKKNKLKTDFNYQLLQLMVRYLNQISDNSMPHLDLEDPFKENSKEDK